MFLDTAGLIACQDGGEKHHAQALSLLQRTPRKLTHNYVLAEFAALARLRGWPRQAALRFLQSLEENPEVHVVWVDREIHVAARQMLQRQWDKAYSLCDAVSFILMRDNQETDALTSDRHFEQAGFRRLLKP